MQIQIFRTGILLIAGIFSLMACARRDILSDQQRSAEIPMNSKPTANSETVPPTFPALPPFRITSYNVCYTKLLRLPLTRTDAAGNLPELPGASPARADALVPELPPDLARPVALGAGIGRARVQDASDPDPLPGSYNFV